MADLIYVRGTSDQVRQVLAAYVLALGGQGGDPSGSVHELLLALGMALRGLIFEACLVKATGATGPDGITWEKLKRATIARRPVTKGEIKALGIGGPRERGLLTPAQNQRWKRIFATRKVRFMSQDGLSDREASARAAQIAWATLKGEASQTKLEVLGNRVVEIGRDTGRLFNSLSPGVVSADAILETDLGRVIVGTNRPGSGRFHERRPLWPRDGELPAAWSAVLVALLERGVRAAFEALLK